MGQLEPSPELLGCFVRSLPVKRHHGGRHARRTRKLRTPQVADAYNLNVVRAAADDLFEVLNGHGDEGKPDADFTRPLRQIKRSGSRSVHPQPDCPPKAPRVPPAPQVRIHPPEEAARACREAVEREESRSAVDSDPTVDCRRSGWRRSFDQLPVPRHTENSSSRCRSNSGRPSSNSRSNASCFATIRRSIRNPDCCSGATVAHSAPGR